MKRIISVLLVMLSVSMLYAKDATYSVFKKYFDPKADCYEFNARNPFFAGKFYIKNLKQFKNRIIKETYENYILDEKGLKSYSDSYIRDVSYKYYFFDSEGRISDVYYINVADNNYIAYKSHENYSCNKTDYLIVEKDLKRNKTVTEKGSLKITDKTLICTFFENNPITEYEFSKNQLLRRNPDYNNSIKTYKLTFNDNTNIYEYSMYWKGYENVNFITEYDRCCVVKESKIIPDGSETEIYESTGPETGVIVFAKEGKEKEIHKEYVRKFNSSGFLEYEEIKPYGKTEGEYSIRRIEILSEKDDFFNEYF